MKLKLVRFMAIGAAAAAVVSAGGALGAASASATVAEFGCTTQNGFWWNGWTHCYTARFRVIRARHFSVRVLDSGGNKPISVQLRRHEAGDVLAETDPIHPTSPNNVRDRWIAGTYAFKPEIWAKADAGVDVATTIRVRFEAH